MLSETGFVFAWSAIVDPDMVLGRGAAGHRIDEHVAWMQLGGGLLLPGGSWGGMGVGSVILRRFGMPTKLIAERQFNLSFLNTGVDALALVIFGLGLAVGIFAGEGNVLLALAAVLLHQAIGLLVPLIGGAIAYTILRRRLGPLPTAANGPAIHQAGAKVLEAADGPERRSSV